MASKIGFSFSCLSSSPFHYFQHNTNANKLRLTQIANQQSVAPLAIYDKDKPYRYIHGVPKLRRRLQKQQTVLVVGSEDRSQISDLKTAVVEPENHDSNPGNIFPISNLSLRLSGNDGKPGVVSFYNRAFSRDNEVILSTSERTRNSISWFMGPAVLVAAFVAPFSLPDVLFSICGDSLLLFFLVLFFTEVIFYSGVAVFLLLLDRLMRPIQLDSSPNNGDSLTPQMGQRISSVATLVLSIGIPMATMGLVWPWIGPLAAVTFGQYLAGIVVQFTFEQLARYWKSPSWAAIPFIFQMYRLHQIYRSGNLLAYLSLEVGAGRLLGYLSLFGVRAAEMTNSKLHVTSSLDTLAIALQFLLVLCMWSFSSFLMRFLPSASATMQ